MLLLEVIIFSNIFINESKIFRKMEALVVIQKVFRKVGLK